MKIFSINFNHLPSQKKPITIAICEFKKNRGSVTITSMEGQLLS